MDLIRLHKSLPTEQWQLKSSIRDTARVLDLPLFDADRIAKLIPTMSKVE